MNLIRVATFNTFGIPFFTPNPVARMKAIGQAFANMNLDIVGFQEVFARQYCEALLEAMQVKYSCYFHEGVLGSGLLITSRYPLESTQFRPYSLKGKPEKLGHGTYLTTPGIGFVIAQTPWGPIEVLNTHLIANFSPDQYDEHFIYRCAQIFELAEFVTELSMDSPKIILGDFNILPGRIEYQIMKDMLYVGDVWSELQPDENTPTVNAENLLVQARKPHLRKSEKIDYIFFRNGQMLQMRPKRISLSMQETFTFDNGKHTNYSDHYAVEAELEVGLFSGEKIPKKMLKENFSQDKLTDIFTSGLRETNHRQQLQLAIGSLSFIGSLIILILDLKRSEGIWFESLFILINTMLALSAIFFMWLALSSTKAEIHNLKSLLERLNLRK